MEQESDSSRLTVKRPSEAPTYPAKRTCPLPDENVQERVEQPPATFPFVMLPNDHLTLILNHLSPAEIIPARAVCKRWLGIIGIARIHQVDLAPLLPKISGESGYRPSKHSSVWTKSQFARDICALDVACHPPKGDPLLDSLHFNRLAKFTGLRHMTAKCLDSALLYLWESQLHSVNSLIIHKLYWAAFKASQKHQAILNQPLVFPNVTSLQFQFGAQVDPYRLCAVFPNLTRLALKYEFYRIERSEWHGCQYSKPPDTFTSYDQLFPCLTSLFITQSFIFRKNLDLLLSLPQLAELSIAQCCIWMRDYDVENGIREMIEARTQSPDPWLICSPTLVTLRLPRVDQVIINMPLLDNLTVDFCNTLDASLCPLLDSVAFASPVPHIDKNLTTLSRTTLKKLAIKYYDYRSTQCQPLPVSITVDRPFLDSLSIISGLEDEMAFGQLFGLTISTPLLTELVVNSTACDKMSISAPLLETLSLHIQQFVIHKQYSFISSLVRLVNLTLLACDGRQVLFSGDRTAGPTVQDFPVFHYPRTVRLSYIDMPSYTFTPFVMSLTVSGSLDHIRKLFATASSAMPHLSTLNVELIIRDSSLNMFGTPAIALNIPSLSSLEYRTKKFHCPLLLCGVVHPNLKRLVVVADWRNNSMPDTNPTQTMGTTFPALEELHLHGIVYKYSGSHVMDFTLPNLRSLSLGTLNLGQRWRYVPSISIVAPKLTRMVVSDCDVVTLKFDKISISPLATVSTSVAGFETPFAEAFARGKQVDADCIPFKIFGKTGSPSHSKAGFPVECFVPHTSD